jgi:membrane protease subunit HflC
MRVLLSLIVLAVMLVVLRLCFFTVDATEYAYVTVLGKHEATYDGADSETGAGLHFGWPWPIRSVQRLDRRLQHFDLPATELLTHDPEGKTIDKTLTVEAYVCWRIPDRKAVNAFILSLGAPERARDILGKLINSQLGAAISQMRMDDLVSTQPGKEAGKTRVDETMDRLQARLLASLQDQVERDYGIGLVDVRLRRFNHPGEVRQSIFDRIRSERKKKVTEYQTEGELEAKKIESKAEERRREILAKARYDEEKLKGQADADAMRIRNQAHSQDPEFYTFLKKMEKLYSVLADNKTVLLLSTHRPLFDLLFQPPRPNGSLSPGNPVVLPKSATPKGG